jgi:hydrogenase-4 membrane subunit HyfE
MEMMHMTAMESLKDVNMIALDLVAGTTGLILFLLILNGIKNYTKTVTESGMSLIPLVFLVLISRIIIDFVYDKFVSKTNFFGGSNEEFIYSSLVWFVLAFVYVKFVTKKNKVFGTTNTTIVYKLVGLYISTVIMMMATARLTHWG